MPQSPPPNLPSSGHVPCPLKGRWNQGVSSVFNVFGLVRGTISWRWGESNPLGVLVMWLVEWYLPSSQQVFELLLVAARPCR